jgi:hypothetical protein
MGKMNLTELEREQLLSATRSRTNGSSIIFPAGTYVNPVGYGFNPR